MVEREVPIDPNFRKILYEQTCDDDTAIGPNFMEEYMPKSRPSITYAEIIPFFSEVYLQLTFLSIYLVSLLLARTSTS